MNNQTIDGVPRAAIETLLAGRGGSAQADAARTLRALLDEPSECRCKRYGKGNPHWPCPVHLVPAAQPQGEPVAEIVSKYGDPEAFGERELITLKDISKFPYGTKLYAEQPAPVAVVIDDNVEFEKWWMSTPILRKQKIQIAQEAWFARANLSK